MKKVLLSVIIPSLALVACVKQEEVNQNNQQDRIEKVFTVSSPETRTYIAASGEDRIYNVKWSGADRIRVMAATSRNQYDDFVLISGEGMTTATFKGTIDAADAAETKFYAVYPSTVVIDKVSGDEITVGSGTTGKGALGHDMLAVKDGYDPSFAVMAAVTTDGTFSFVHGMTYFKVEVASEGIASLRFETENSGRVYGRPVINLAAPENTNMTSADSGNNYVTIAPSTGTLVPGVYYIPTTCKPGSNFGDLKVTFSDADGVTIERTTSVLKSVKMQAGKIYNLGTLPAVSFGPAISYTAPAKLAYDATSGSFPYAVANPVSGQSVTATLESGVDWISNIVVGADAVTFTCSKNNATDAQERSAVITLHYTGAADVPVTVTQGIGGVEDYVWDFSTTEWQSALNSSASEACLDTNGNKNKSGWTVSYSGLTYSSGEGDGKWSTSGYIQPNGSGYYESETKFRRYFSFSSNGDGHLYMWISGTGGSGKTATVYAQHGYKKASNADWNVESSSLTSSDTERIHLSVTSGDLVVYLSTGMRIKRIEFHTDEL
jgi:hypothetical protein